MNKKKKEEQIYLDNFLSLLNITPTSIQLGESPDFTIVFQQRKIGIELVCFHSDLKGTDGKARRAIEETWNLLQQQIMKEVKKHKLLNQTYGLLTFKQLELPNKSKLKDFVEELIRLSIKMIRDGVWETEPNNEYPLLARYIRTIRLEKTNCYITWDWNHGGSFVGFKETELLRIVEPKIKKISNYKTKNIDEIWLVIISGHMISQAMGLNLLHELRSFSELNNYLLQSGYRKVYIFQYMFNVVYEWPNWVKIGKENFVK